MGLFVQTGRETERDRSCAGGKCVCNPGVQATANGKCGNIIVIADGGTTTGDCVAKGGVCVTGDQSRPPNRHLAGPGEGACAGDATCWVPDATAAACTVDTGCNDDPKISSSVGTCTLGICVCRPGAYLQPSGKCGFAAPPLCLPQGGACRQNPDTCLAGELRSDQNTNMSCGDLIAAVCCVKATACKAPIDFTCCSKTNLSGPICVSGWKTCLPDQTPTALPGTCN